MGGWKGDGERERNSRGALCSKTAMVLSFFFFSQKSMDWNLPPLSCDSNIYLNVLSINITRLVL